jgi:hypothetical protein
MKVRIPKPVNWFGPYQLASFLCCWAKQEKDEYGFKDEPQWVHDFGTWLSGGQKHDSILAKVLSWYDGVRRKFPWNKETIKIDYWDTWSMDCTLSPIILPMLKQLKARKHGSGFIDLEDVPEHLRTVSTEDYDGQMTFDFYDEAKVEGPDVHSRYDWVLDEMIWAFEQLCDDYAEEKFWIVKPKADWEDMSRPFEEDEKARELKWLVRGKLDAEGLKAHQDRVQNGLRLFGVYFMTLWD